MFFFREKSSHLSNSQLTSTTSHLSQNTLYSTDNYRDLSRALEKVLNGGDTVDFGKTSDLQDTGTLKIDRMSRKKIENGTVNGFPDPVMNGDVNGQDSDSSSMSGAPKNPREAQWFTRPAHLDKAYSALRSDTVSVVQPSMISGSSNTQHHVDTTSLSKPATLSELYSQASMVDVKSKEVEGLVKEFFPLTLGAGYTIRSASLHPTPVSKTLTFSPTPRGLKRPSSAPWKPKRSKSPSRRRPGSAHSASTGTSSSTSKSSAPVDKLYLLASEAPITG